MDTIELEVADIRNAENPSEAYALILKEKKGEKLLPVMIGWSEARSLVLAMNKATSRRPTPHDLFKSLGDATGYILTSIFIYKFKDGVYYTYLRMTNNENNIEIDSRTSDAVTLALNYRVPIFIDGDLLEHNGLTPDKSGNDETDFPYMTEDEIINEELYINQQLAEMTDDELDILLEGAIESEDFELASKIHIEIEKRRI